MIKIETKIAKDEDNIQNIALVVEDNNGTLGEYLSVANYVVKTIVNDYNMNINDVLKRLMK